MFELSSTILDFFVQVLGSFLDFTPDSIHKRCGLSKAFLQKGFELFPGRRNSALNLAFVLLPAKENSFLQEESSKRYTLTVRGSCSFEIVFAILAEVVIFHMQISIIRVRVSGLKQPIGQVFPWPCWRLVPGFLDAGLYKLPEQHVSERSCQSGSRFGAGYGAGVPGMAEPATVDPLRVAEPRWRSRRRGGMALSER